MQVKPVNKAIRAKKVILIGSDGKQLGEMDIDSALSLASKNGMDLVQVSVSDPPVCKIMDYSKEQYKKRKSTKSHVKRQKMKEVRFTYEIAEHDLGIKRSQIERFLEDGHKVKLTLRFKKRLLARPRDLEEKITNMLDSIEFPHKMEGNISKGPQCFSAIISSTKGR